jgi:WD40 repeat protein
MTRLISCLLCLLAAPVLLEAGGKDSRFEFVVQSGHTRGVSALAFSPDGKKLYSGGIDGKLNVWDLESGYQTASLREHSREIGTISTNPDGSKLLTSDYNYNALVWNAAAGSVEARFDRKARWTHALYSPDGRFIVTFNIFAAERPYDAILRKGEDGEELFALEGHQNDVSSVAFSLGGKYVATASYDHYARIYELATGKGVWMLEHQSAVQDIVFAGKNDEYAATIESFGYELLWKPRNAVFLWNMKTGKLAKKLQFSKNPPRRLAYNAAADLLFALGDDHKIAIWNVKDLSVKGIFEDKQAEISTFAVDPTGRFVAYGCDDGSIALIDVGTLQEVKRFSNHVVTYDRVVPLLNVRMATIDTDNQHLTVWDLKTGERLYDYDAPRVKIGVDEESKAPIYQERSFAVDPKGVHAFIAEGPSLSCANTETGLFRFKKKAFPETIHAVEVSERGSVLALTGDHTLFIANAADGSPIASVPFGAEAPHAVQFAKSSDDVFYSDGNALLRFNLQSKQKSQLASFTEPIKGIFVSTGEIGAYSQKKLSVLSAATNAEVMSYTSVMKDIDHSIISRDGRYVLKTNRQMMDIKELDAIWTGEFPSTISSGMFVQNDAKLLLTLSDGSMMLCDAKTGTQLSRYSEVTKSGRFDLNDMSNKDRMIFKKGVASIAMFPGDSLFAVIGRQMPEIKICRITEWSGLMHAVNVLAVGKNDYVLYTNPSALGYSALYKASKGAVKGLAFKNGEEIFSFQDCDLMLNRPDWMLDELGWVDKDQIEMYRKLVYKRQQRELGAKAPRWEMVATLGRDFLANRPTIELEQAPPLMTKEPVLAVAVKASSTSKALLNHFNVYLNGVKIDHAVASAKIASETQQCEQTVSVPLAAGLNAVQLSVTDGDGNESLKKNFTVTCTKPKKKGVLYLVTVGVSEYAQTEYNLTYAAKDAGDIAAYFEKNKKNFDDVKIIRLMNHEATKANILNVGRQLSGATVDDEVIFFFAGHGLLDDELNYYMANTDIEFTAPGKNGVLYDEVMTMIEELPSIKKVVLIDACHSGEVEKDAQVQTAAAPQANVKMIAGATRGMKAANAPKGIAPSKVKELFLSFSNNSGIAVITSAGGAEFAFESSQWKNGVFTYNLLDGLQSRHADLNGDGTITVSELKEYVSGHVKEMTQGMQMPTTRNENLMNDFRVY